MKKIVSLVCILAFGICAYAADVYINPGHGLWDGNGRNLAIVGHSVGDTLAFWESSTNLWKSYYLRDELEQAGLKVLMSHTKVGPAGHDGEAPYGGKELDVIAEEANSCGATYFISIHSNATGEGTLTDYPTFFYNTGVGDSYNMAKTANKSWLDVWTTDLNATDKIEFCSYASYINGDLRTGHDEYGVLRTNSVPGFMAEAFFHTYRPHRHRACNPDRCCVEGEAYARAILEFFGKPANPNGFIYGVVVDDTEEATESLYTPAQNNWQKKKPLQGVKVQLRAATGEIVKGFDIYPYVDRCMKNQDYYTTDNFHNGVFVFKNVSPGLYYLDFLKPGYADKTVAVTVNANKTTCQVVRLTQGNSSGAFPNGEPGKVEYELNGGTMGNDTLPSIITQNFILPSPTKEGKYFLGWYWDADFTLGPVKSLLAGESGKLFARWGDAPIALNAYAYKLSTLTMDGAEADNHITINYWLNDMAKSVEFVLLRNDSVQGSIALTEESLLTAGNHSAEIDLNGLPEGDYNWGLKVTSATLTEPFKVTTDESKFNFYWGEGLAIDNNPESPYFGNIYVTESWGKQSLNNGKKSIQGVNIFSPDLSTDGNTYQGRVNGSDISWQENEEADGNGFYKAIHGPMRVFIDKSGMVYINDDGRWSGTNTSQLYRFDPAHPDQDWEAIFDPAHREQGNKQYTRINAMAVTGVGEQRKLYIVDWSDDIVTFDIGNNTNIGSGRTIFANLPAAKYSQIPNRTLALDNAKDGLWMFQYTGGSTTKPLASHWSANGICDYSILASDVASDNFNGGGAVSTDGSLLAFCGGTDMLVYQITYQEDVPAATLLYRIPNVRTASGIAFDVVNNLYFVSSASQYMEVYALPRTDCSYITKALNDVVTVTPTESGINNPRTQAQVQKVIRDNQVYIIRNGEHYNTLGVRVK